MISEINLIRAIDKAQKLDIKDKELICDEIFIEQPNLLASVLVQQQMGNKLEEIDVLLDILIVLHLAVEESGKRIQKVSEEDQEHQLKVLSATIRFSEGMNNSLVQSSINQYIANHNEKLLLAYVLGAMKDAKFFENNKENSKYLIMAGVNLVNCIANAQKLT
jgi:hypothetical protein